MSTDQQQGQEHDGESRSGFEAGAFAHLHSVYRNDRASLQVAIANATGERRRRLEQVLTNLRNEKR